MNKEKCNGCEWYGKPYWSINNPCDNCPRDNIQVITRWEDPTIKELQQENKQLKEEIQELKADYGNKAQIERDLLQLRIDKAIEFIESRAKNAGVALMPREIELLEILKGDRND